MKPVDQKSRTSLTSLCRGVLKSCVAHLLVFALVVSQLPPHVAAQSPAATTPQTKPIPQTYKDMSCDLPGISCGGHTGLIAGVAAAGAGAVILIVYEKKHGKGSTVVKLDTKAVKFGDFTPGQPVKLSVPLKDLMNAPITVKEVAVDDPSGALTIGAARQGEFTLAPGEAYDIPVTLNTSNAQGKARIRIVATSPKAKKDVVQFIKVSYGHGESKHHRLIPKL